MGYDLKCLWKWEMLFKCVDSVNCELLYKFKNRKCWFGDVFYDVCILCKKLYWNIFEVLKWKVNGKFCIVLKLNCNWKFLSFKVV